ncbi:MAG: cytochrome P450 [Alphaproteobacteria bacterium]|nr:cytochrome P450 [Alphaproteobacteria bacterium]
MNARAPGQVPVLPGGTLSTMRRFRREPVAMFERARALGPVVQLPIRQHPVFVLTAPEPAHHLLHAPLEQIDKLTRGGRLLLRTLGPSLLTTEADPWRQRRRTAQPHFRRGAMDTWTGVVRREAERLVDRWLAADGPVDVVATTNQAALRIVAEAMLGSRLGTDDEVVGRDLDTVLELFIRFTTFPIDGIDRWPLPQARRYRAAIASLRRIADRLVLQRRQGDARDDVLGTWIAARDAGELDDDDLRAEVLTLLLAGHETTANAVAWTLGLLAQDPDALDAVTHAARAGDTALVDAAVAEGLRLYPPAWVVSRTTHAPLDLGATTLPAGAYAFVGIAAIHRHPDLWEEPDAFRLDRWTQQPPKDAWLPFGGGPRRCIGEHFARLEAREILAATLRRARVEPVGPLPPPQASVTLRPKGGMWVRVRGR